MFNYLFLHLKEFFFSFYFIILHSSSLVCLFHCPIPFNSLNLAPFDSLNPIPHKIYLDLTTTLESPRLEVSVGHVYAIMQVINAGKLLLPPGLFHQLESQRRGRQASTSHVGDQPGVCPLASWDIGRCMMHGKFDATLLGGKRGS